MNPQPLGGDALADMEFREVSPERWGDLEALFEGRGGPKYCWCMVWRPKPKGAGRMDNASKKRALRGFADAGTPIGLLGYQDGEPAAWCSIAPRDAAYRRMSRLPDPDGVDSASVWAIVCFFAIRRLRGRGITRKLIAAAVSLAKSKGAAMVEAYPVNPDSPSYKFMGTAPTFQSMGFADAGMAGKRRHVMRLILREKRE